MDSALHVQKTPTEAKKKKKNLFNGGKEILFNNRAEITGYSYGENESWFLCAIPYKKLIQNRLQAQIHKLKL